MAVLLHVQGPGRDPVRPFADHLIHTAAWERFSPKSVGRDIDTIVLSPSDPAAALDIVGRLREAGRYQPIKIIPLDGAAWRELGSTPMPGVEIVLGGVTGLPAYVPQQDPGPGRSSLSGATVIPMPSRVPVPVGGGKGMLPARLAGQGQVIAEAVTRWVESIQVEGRALPDGEITAPAPPDRPGPTVAVPAPASPDSGPLPGRPQAGSGGGVDLEPPRRPDAAVATLPPRGRADSSVLPPPPSPRGAIVLPETPGVPAPSGPVGTASAAGPEPGEPGPPRRRAREIKDPAVLIPALLEQADRLQEIADTPHAVAEYIRGSIGADAVEVLVPTGSDWVAAALAGAAAGAGRIADVVDVPRLVAWLDTLEPPVVIDGGDLGAPGSLVLTAPAAGGSGTVGLLLVWRGPGKPEFDQRAKTSLREIAADAAGPLELGLQLRQLARALSRFQG
jgi:hypothetical protein